MIKYVIIAALLLLPLTQISYSQDIPDWIKNNAGWWAEGTIDDVSFVGGIQFLIKEGIMTIPAEDMESESELTSENSELQSLQADLDACQNIVTAYKRLDCEKPIKQDMLLYEYKSNAEKFNLGPITYYWFGIGSEGNEFEITSTGQSLLSIRMLAENTSSEIVSLNCTSPSICNYDISDGQNIYKYSGMDFTSGQIALNPNDAREFNILFGPNIGYGGTKFEYDPSKDYIFRISEPWGGTEIPLNIE